MDIERLKIHAETTGVRGRGWVRFVISLFGVALLTVGGYNLLLAGLLVTPEFLTAYRPILAAPFVTESTVIADVAAIAVGTVIAWLAS